MALLGLLVLVVVPTACLHLDEGHLVADPDCPCCALLHSYVVVLTLVTTWPLLVQVLLARRSASSTVGAPSSRPRAGPGIRGPPDPS